MKIIILGAPGAGKGTQATRICNEFNIAHISTGDALRANIKAGTELGKYAKSFIDKGMLVPDDVIIKMVAERITEDDCNGGFLFDGFPRTITQAIALDKLVEIDKVINLDVNFSVLLARISGRRMCRCGESYHISTYKSDKCAKCGEPLYQRDDDNEETVAERLEVYRKQTAPLVDYYMAQGKLLNVNGNRDINLVFADIAAALRK